MKGTLDNPILTCKRRRVGIDGMDKYAKHDDNDAAANQWTDRLLGAVTAVIDEFTADMVVDDRIQHAGRLNEALLEAQGLVAEMRRAAVRELRESGLTLREIGERTGMTAQRVAQIENGISRFERKTRGGRIN